MNYSEWKPYYDQITNDLHLDRKKDEIASEIFDQLISRYSKNYIGTDSLKNIIYGKKVFIFGAAPSLEKDIKENLKFFDENVVIAADGATSALLKFDIIPDLIVTDLDGVITDQLHANNEKAIMIIHAHGDNISVVQSTISKIKGPYLGTTQTNPSHYHHLKNYGGFTDGDRAVFIAYHFKPNQILLGGFNCHANPGYYSFQKNRDIEQKRKKLMWCHRLIQLIPKEQVKKL
jgi:uncharacterized Rossmann fold enzyme